MDFRATMAAFILAFATASCGGVDEFPDAADNPIRVAVLPDQSRDALARRFAPLIGHLEEATAYEFDFVTHADYLEFTNAFAERSVDLAWFGGLTFVIAERTSNAEALVMRDIDNRFTSYFIVRSGSAHQSIMDFQAGRFAFGPRLSTSGHLMPRHFMRERGIIAEDFFADARHTSGHDETAFLVRDGEVDLGVVNHVILDSMIADGRLGANDLMVLETTPTYSNYVWAVQSHLDPRMKVALRNAFLDLDPANSEHSSVLSAQGARGYLPATPADFDATRAAAEAAGLLDARS